MNRRNFLKLIAASTLLPATYTIAIERYLVQINMYEIPLKRLPKAFHGFRLVHLTDLHLGLFVPDFFIAKVIDIANSLQPDIIVCTGDYVRERNNTTQIDRVWPILNRLTARYGVSSVLGNHDHWANFDRSLYWLERTQQNLRHQVKAITIEQQTIWFGGAGDWWEDELGIDNAFAKVPKEACKILLAHNPDTVDQAYKTSLDLVIAGHTHGGQVNIPFYGTPILPVRNKRYSAGVIPVGETTLFISKGIGWAVAPIRFNCFPEIAVLKLVTI